VKPRIDLQVDRSCRIDGIDGVLAKEGDEIRFQFEGPVFCSEPLHYLDMMITVTPRIHKVVPDGVSVPGEGPIVLALAYVEHIIVGSSV
jgi:hypothetical protein